MLGEVDVASIYRLPGGVIVGDSGALLLWSCVHCVTSIIRTQLLNNNNNNNKNLSGFKEPSSNQKPLKTVQRRK